MANISKLKILLNIGVKGAAALLAFASQILMVRVLGQEVYGFYVMFITYCSLIVIFSRSGLDVLSVRRVSVLIYKKCYGEVRGLFIKTLGITAALCVVWSILFDSLRMIERAKSLISFQFDLKWAAAGVMSMTLVVVTLAFIRGMKKVILADVLDSIIKPITMLITLAGSVYLLHGNNAGYALLSFVFSNILVFFLGATLVWSHTRSKTDAQYGGSSEPILSLKNKAIFILNGLLTYAYFQFDTLLVGNYLGQLDVAAYNMACNFVRLVILIPMIITAQLQPVLAPYYQEKKLAEAKNLVRDAIKKCLVAACTGFGALALAGYQLLKMTSPGFEKAYFSLLVLAAAHVVNSILLVLTASLMMQSLQRLVVISQAMGLCVCLPLYFVLLPAYGLVGAPIAVLLGLATNLGVCAFFFKKYSA